MKPLDVYSAVESQEQVTIVHLPCAAVPTLDDAPLGLDDYEALDLRQEYWAGIGPGGGFAASWRPFWRPGAWRRASLNPDDILADFDLPGQTLVQVSLAELLFTPSRTGHVRGVAILDGYPHVAKFIEAMPGER